MSDNKSAKKNKKRKTKTSKIVSGNVLSNEELLSKLKLDLDIAKAEKNHEAAKIIREQVWILGDIVAGVETDVPEEDFNRILLSIGDKFQIDQNHLSPLTDKTKNKANGCEHVVITDGRLCDDRKLKNLRKKLEQIEKLKLKKKAGEKLEENQVEKIKSESEVINEIKQIEEILSKLSFAPS